MKIAVYTIALNEAENAERWARSCADADYRVVADTGSTDDTIERLRAEGVIVHSITVRPWRFDLARNAAMALIPDDVDVCCTLDMDMCLEPGWRQKLEAAWTPDTTSMFCTMVLNFSGDPPRPFKTYYAKNFHSRWGVRFKRAAHEALFFTGEDVMHTCGEIVIQHARGADSDHGQYLSLMETARAEDPMDSQICFWLGREHMWRGQNERAVELLESYLGLPTATWKDERSEAMRYLAKLQPDKTLEWLEKARAETPYRREVWLDLAEYHHDQEDWLNLFWACVNGLERTRRTLAYVDDENSWGYRLYDLAAIAAWRLNAMDKAVEWGSKALELDPDSQRLQKNLDHYVRRRDELRAAS